MGSDGFEILVNGVKIVIIFLLMVQMVPFLVWVERRGSAFMQNRFGPNRVGPLGLFQLLADLVKFLRKEDFLNKNGRAGFFYIAPIIGLVPAALAFGLIPLSQPIEIQSFEFLGHLFGPYTFHLQSFVMDTGIVAILAVGSLSVYALLLAGWASGNKFSLYGALRASAQTISYELALGLSLVGVLLIFNTFHLLEIVTLQNEALSFHFLGAKKTLNFLPAWGIFYQPFSALIFFIALFAEANRLPFDLPEAEAELVAGYHTEYGGIKVIMFYMAEYGHMMVASALMVTLFFGGYTWWPFTNILEDTLGVFGQTQQSLLTSFMLHILFMTKVLGFLWIFIWVRWTLPRFRFDQLMDLGWRTLLPLALLNSILTMAWVLMMHSGWN